MAGFVTARDGIFNVINANIVGSTPGYLKGGFKLDVGFITDAVGEGYPYFTVAPSFDKNKQAFTTTDKTRTDFTIVLRLYDLYKKDEPSETAFLTLVDLALTTLRSRANITLNNTVVMNQAADGRLGYNDSAQPTMRVAEIDCLVTQFHTY